MLLAGKDRTAPGAGPASRANLPRWQSVAIRLSLRQLIRAPVQGGFEPGGAPLELDELTSRFAHFRLGLRALTVKGCAGGCGKPEPLRFFPLGR